MRIWWVSALGLLVACSPASQLPTAPSKAEDVVTVSRVVDGDTFVAQAGKQKFRVRLIGVDTPETVKPQTPVQCFGPEASSYAKHTLNGRRVRLVYDVDRWDRYGRVLAYVYVGGEFFNLELIRRGYGVVLTIPPDVAHVDEFVAAQVAARTSGRGLWSACAA